MLMYRKRTYIFISIFLGMQAFWRKRKINALCYLLYCKICFVIDFRLWRYFLVCYIELQNVVSVDIFLVISSPQEKNTNISVKKNRTWCFLIKTHLAFLLEKLLLLHDLRKLPTAHRRLPADSCMSELTPVCDTSPSFFSGWPEIDELLSQRPGK